MEAQAKTPVRGQTTSADKKRFTATVVEVIMSDGFLVRKDNGEEVKIFLSSIRLPREPGKDPRQVADRKFLPLYHVPYMHEAREFLRKRLIGKRVQVIVDYVQPKADNLQEKTCCTVLCGTINVAEALIGNGLSKVVRHRAEEKNRSSRYEALVAAEAKAEAQKVGVFGPKATAQPSTRNVQEIQNDAVRSAELLPRLLNNNNNGRIESTVEFVSSGSRLKLYIPKESVLITFLLDGITCPRSAIRTGSSPSPGDPFGDEAHKFAHDKIMQHDVSIEVEGVDKSGNLIGYLFPAGSTQAMSFNELLLSEGLATVHPTAKKSPYYAELVAAEKRAKRAKLNIWRDYEWTEADEQEQSEEETAKNLDEVAQITEQVAQQHVSVKKPHFQAVVTEVIMADSLMVLKDNGEETKIFLSSIRLPRKQGDEARPVGRKFLPLYDVPYMYEAREFLRKRLIGKRVDITVDFEQETSETTTAKTCCTVRIGGLNIAEALVAKGLSRAILYRADDANRSSCYEDLLAAEEKAEKGKKGIFVEKNADKCVTQRLQELRNDVQRSKQFLPYLQRNKRVEGIVEFVSSGSRVRIYIPKETVLITFLLGGVSCPRSATRTGSNPVPGDPYGDDALAFTRRLTLQRKVEIEVEGLDKSGNFIGYMFITPTEGAKQQNLSELLVLTGLATVHPTADRSPYYAALLTSEQRAKDAKVNIWENYKPEEEKTEDSDTKPAEERGERTFRWRRVVVSEIRRGSTRFFAQNADEGEKVEDLLRNLRAVLAAHPPPPGSLKPRRGDLVAAQFSADNQWYRARVEAVRGHNTDLLYIDYGNQETLAVSKLAALPQNFSSIPPLAKEYSLALVKVPNSDEFADAMTQALQQYFLSAPEVEVNTEYSIGGVEHVTVHIQLNGKTIDVGRAVIEEGCALADRRPEPCLQTLVSEYQEAEKKARRERRNIWEFGDFTGDEA